MRDGEAARQAVHAGTFYPSDPVALARLVDRLLASSGALPRSPLAVVGALVPHAGLAYSGRIAATGWLAVASVHPESILLLGTDHAGRAEGSSVWTGGAWVGPFGTVPIDEPLAGRILELGAPFVADDATHRDEHSLEVQMPFVARLAPRARIVPILVGGHSASVPEAAGRMLGGLLARAQQSGRVAVVASSDLAHYPAEAVARRVGNLMLAPLLRLDTQGLVTAEEEARRLPGVACGMCGPEPVHALMAAMRVLGATGALLAEATSADVPLGDPLRCVGYAAVAFNR